MRRPRHLSAEERALWDHVTRRDKRKVAVAVPAPQQAPLADPPPPEPPALPFPAPVPSFRVGQSNNRQGGHDLLPGLATRLATAPVRMDANAYGKLRRGKLVPEGRIDLHGMTLSQAHPALTRFILTAHAARKRLVLVITGKGKLRDDFAPIPARQGIIRHQVPQWLALPPLGPLVLQIAPAHVSHGGEGAYYVYLRRAG